MNHETKNKEDRREFLKTAASVGGGLTIAAHNSALADEAAAKRGKSELKIAVVGIGNRGKRLLSILLELEGVQVKAVCDVIPSRAAFGQSKVVKAGQAKPNSYDQGQLDFRRLCERESLDLVINATPWKWHVPISVAAMKSGKHTATEVPAALTVDGCWELVETAEKTNKHCVMLENCCYGRTEMLFLNMVRKGLLGEIVQAEAGYMHEYRVGLNGWRFDHTAERNGNLYPTHGLGPVAQCMNIDRGDRFDYLVSMSTKSTGVNDYFRRTLGTDHPRSKRKYAQGDVNVSLIRTINGASITVGYNTQLPRPYSRLNLLQGTKGIAQGFPERVSIEGANANHSWRSIEDFRAEHEHPLWKKLQTQAKGKGHGGMDYILMYRLVEAFRNGTEPDMDVYDAASWSVMTALTEESVANRSRPVDFPDFTRGKWKTRKPLGIID